MQIWTQVAETAYASPGTARGKKMISEGEEKEKGQEKG
jgi:hypothetical protein